MGNIFQKIIIYLYHYFNCDTVDINAITKIEYVDKEIIKEIPKEVIIEKIKEVYVNDVTADDFRFIIDDIPMTLYVNDKNIDRTI